jgi:hypothetical protein
VEPVIKGLEFLFVGAGLHAAAFASFMFVEFWVLWSEASALDLQNGNVGTYKHAAAVEILFNILGAVSLLGGLYLLGIPNYLGVLALLFWGVLRWWVGFSDEDGGWNIFKSMVGGMLSDVVNSSALVLALYIARQFFGQGANPPVATVATAQSEFVFKTGLLEGDFLKATSAFGNIYYTSTLAVVLGVACVFTYRRIAKEHKRRNGNGAMIILPFIMLGTSIGLALMTRGDWWLVLGAIFVAGSWVIYGRQFRISLKGWVDALMESHFVYAPLGLTILVAGGVLGKLSQLTALVNDVWGRVF